MNKNEIIKKIEEQKTRSKWEKGINEYVIELLDNLEGEITLENLLNGAENWTDYSYGGCSLIYDSDICSRLATPSEQKIKKYGELNPNSSENWLDIQARALYQAACKILKLAKI